MVGSEFLLILILKIKHKWIIKRFHLIEKSNMISIRTSAFTLEVPEIVYKYIPEYLAFSGLTSLGKKEFLKGN